MFKFPGVEKDSVGVVIGFTGVAATVVGRHTLMLLTRIAIVSMRRLMLCIQNASIS